MATVDVDNVHPLALSTKLYDPNTLALHEAMASGDHEEFHAVMSKEIKELKGKRMWNIVTRPSNKNVLPSTWVFHHKHYPDGRMHKYKAYFCMHGDKQLPGIDYYMPVAAWSMICLMSMLTVVYDLHTKQVDPSTHLRRCIC